MHKMCDLDELSTSHFSDTTVKTWKKFWKLHLSIDVNGAITLKLSRKSCKVFNPLQLKYTWSKFNKIDRVITLVIWLTKITVICWTEVTI